MPRPPHLPLPVTPPAGAAQTAVLWLWNRGPGPPSSSVAELRFKLTAVAAELTPLTYVVRSQEAGREILEGEAG